MNGFDFSSWYGLWGPKGLPADITAKLQAEVGKALAAPEVKERLAILGFEPIGSTSGEFAKYIDDESAKYQKIISDAKIKAE
jgi:tripartite-type tricarboxylate transporter receptor subunit TctC